MGYRLNILEVVQSLLPSSVALDTDLNTSENLFFASPEIDSELNDISIVDWEWPRLRTRLAQPNVVEKCSGRALHILDVPLSLGAPKFTMSAADNFGLESNGCCRRNIWRRIGVCISLRVTTNTNDAIFMG